MANVRVYHRRAAELNRWAGHAQSTYNGGSVGHSVIHIIRTPATPRQIEDMLQALETYIKLAVDIERGILAGGGVMHADCESSLLEDGSAQEDVWGADWNPASQQVTFESLINIRPRQQNPSLEILDPERREHVAQVARQLLEQP